MQSKLVMEPDTFASLQAKFRVTQHRNSENSRGSWVNQLIRSAAGQVEGVALTVRVVWSDAIPRQFRIRESGLQAELL